MSSIEKMELVNIVGLLKYLDDTLIQCIRSGVFHIEQSSQIAEESGIDEIAAISNVILEEL